MENIVKQRQEFSQNTSNLAHKGNKIVHYRRLVFSLLGQLKDAQLEIIEGSNSYFFGQTNTDLVGQIIIHDVSFYQDILSGGSIGAAEAFLDAKWTSPNLTQVIQVMARNSQELDKIERKMKWLSKFKNLLLRRRNTNSEQGSKRNILAHYDIGNDLYEGFLDASMQYSSAIYSENATTISQAQNNKMRTICERLSLNETDHVIEIGTGWGGLAIYMAQNYGCKVTTTTISDAQFDFAQQKVKALGLEDRITLLKKDYRKLSGQYDKLVSIEMIEAVGHEYLPTFFSTCSDLLKANGKMLIQSITIADNRYEQYRKGVDFIQKYIFPGGCLPSIAEMSRHFEKSTDMVVHQINDIGLHYARTLDDWKNTFEKEWSTLKQLGYNEEFKRLWLFYFSYCEGAFLERVISTHHIVARKPRYQGVEDDAILAY
jgi:cyclopropane-fatty-acyl-phospholipid synthase